MLEREGYNSNGSEAEEDAKKLVEAFFGNFSYNIDVFEGGKFCCHVTSNEEVNVGNGYRTSLISIDIKADGTVSVVLKTCIGNSEGKQTEFTCENILNTKNNTELTEGQVRLLLQHTDGKEKANFNNFKQNLSNQIKNKLIDIFCNNKILLQHTDDNEKANFNNFKQILSNQIKNKLIDICCNNKNNNVNIEKDNEVENIDKFFNYNQEIDDSKIPKTICHKNSITENHNKEAENIITNCVDEFIQNKEIQRGWYPNNRGGTRCLKIQNKITENKNNIKINDIYFDTDSNNLLVTLKINNTEKKITSTYNEVDDENFPSRTPFDTFRKEVVAYLNDEEKLKNFKQGLIKQIMKEVNPEELKPKTIISDNKQKVNQGKEEKEDYISEQQHEELKQENRYITRAIRECLNKFDCCNCLDFDNGRSAHYGTNNSPYIFK